MIFLLLGVLVATAFIVVTRFRTVPEGHVAIVHRFDKYAREQRPLGFICCGRWRKKSLVCMYVNARQGWFVPNVFTEGGLPVDVNLRYSYSLDPSRMHRDQIHDNDEERDEQLRTLLKRVFQDLMYQLGQMPAPSPTFGDDPVCCERHTAFQPVCRQQGVCVADVA